MKNYLRNHIDSYYLPNSSTAPGIKRHENRYGWKDYYIGQHLIFSHRTTVYDREGFPNILHSHRYYEVVIYISGDISYVANEREYLPSRDDIIIFSPGCMHTARMQENCSYDRYVIYFDPEILDFLGEGCLPEIFSQGSANCLSVLPNYRAEFYYIRERIIDKLHAEDDDAAIEAFAYILQLFHLIAKHTHVNRSRVAEIPQKVLDVKRYVDHNFQSISTTTEIANHFFYSREYVSRIFKQYFNTNLSDYLINQKISYAKQLLSQGNSISFTCNAAGFKSSSAFINAFRQRTQQTPSEYRKAHRDE